MPGRGVNVHLFAIWLLLLLCCAQLCSGQPQLFSNNCEEITSNGVKEYYICAEDPISLTAARYRYNLTVDPESSTCGATKQQYCTLELPPVCDVCDRMEPGKSHEPELMIDMRNNQSNVDTWWQSITWAVSPFKPLEVNITLSFDHLYELQNVMTIRFRSGRPERMTLLKSVDSGATWTPLQYYQKNCDDRYEAGVPDNVTAADPRAVICTSRYSEDAPYVNGAVQFDVTNDRFRLFLGDNLANYGALYRVFDETRLNEFLSFTDLRLQLLAPSTGGKSGRDPVSLISYYYAISAITIQASCSCNLHASSCSQQLNGGTKCNCEHNTDGDNCERCLPLYNNKPWKPGFYTPYPRGTANPCEKCQCYEHADSCTYSSELGIGVCDDCQHNTTGVRCEKCQEGFFPNNSLPLSDINRCIACDCEPLGVYPGLMGCEPVTGQCTCKSDDIEGRRCDSCKDGKYGLLQNGTCLDCGCHPYGIQGFNTVCDKVTGQCPCKPNVGQRACDQCKDGFYSFPQGRMSGDCIDCQCDPGGSANLVCDKVTGQCPCRSGVSGLRCDQPISGTYSPDLDYFSVQPRGGTCRLDTDLLTSDNPFTGRVFSVCQGSDTVTFQETDNRHKQPQVIWSYLPALRYSLNSSVPWPSFNLTITILGNSGIDVTPFQLANPEETITGYCNPDGSLPTFKTIEMTELKPGIGEARISSESFLLDARCRYGIEAVVSDPDKANDTLFIDSIVLVPDHNNSTVFIEADPDVRRDQLACEQRLISLASRQAALEEPVCSKFAYGTTLQMMSGALPCGCDSEGTIPATTCEAKGGQCHCKPGVYGRQCDVCAPGFYNKTIEGCTPCSCSVNGSKNLVCDYISGQCPCLANVATSGEPNVLGLVDDLRCRSCLVNYYGHATGSGCRPCGCDVRGTNSSQCDDDGQCECKPTIGGAKCDVCEPGYYKFTTDGCSLCNCSEAGARGIECDVTTGQCSCKQNVNGLKCDSCVSGSFNLDTTNPEGCQRCFCYAHGTQCQSAPGYSAKLLRALETEIQSWPMIDPFRSAMTSHYSAHARFLGNKLTSYGTNITFTAVTRGGDFVDFSAENSVLLEGNGELIKYNSTVAMPAQSEPRQFNVSLREMFWIYNDTMSPDYLQFYKILANLTGLYIQRIFRPAIVVNVIEVTMVTTQPAPPGVEQVNSVEQCTCDPTAHVDGLSCEKCAQGYRRPTVNGSSYETCIACDCNQRTYTDPPICDEDTGVCLNCKNGTNGTQCESCSAFVQDCTVCTDSECGRCIADYWGLDEDGCKPCQCDPVGATSSSCDTVTGQCQCRPNVGQRQCDQCIDNYFMMTTAGCKECDSCYNLVKTDVDQLRTIRDNVTQLLSDLQASDQTAQLGSFSKRLTDTENDMQWLLLYLSEAEAIQTDTMSEVNRLNATLSQFYETLADLDYKLTLAQQNVTMATENTDLGANVTRNIGAVMIEANERLTANTGNATVIIQKLLASIQKVQQTMAGVSNDAIGDVLRVSGIVNTIKSGSAEAKSLADKAYLTAQAAQNLHKQTTSGVSTLEQLVLQIDSLKEETSLGAKYSLGNASLRLDTANMALRNATNMAAIPTDVTSLVNKATMLKNEGQGLKVQGDKATADAADTVTTVNGATVRTNELLRQVDDINGQSGLLQMRLDLAIRQVDNAKVLANRSFEDANKMLNVMKDFNNQVQAVEEQANEALQKVQEIQKLGEQSITDGRRLQDQLQAPLERAQGALSTATAASEISGINSGLFDAVYRSTQSLYNYSKSVLNDVSTYPDAVSKINATVVTPVAESCQLNNEAIVQLKDLQTKASISARNASLRISETSNKINTILKDFTDARNIDLSKLSEIKKTLENTRASFNKVLLANAVTRLKDAMEQQRVQLDSMKKRRGQLQAQIQRLRNIQQQLKS